MSFFVQSSVILKSVKNPFAEITWSCVACYYLYVFCLVFPCHPFASCVVLCCQRTVTTVKRMTSSRAAETTASLSWRRPAMVGCGWARVFARTSDTSAASQTFCRMSIGAAPANSRAQFVFQTASWTKRDRAPENSRLIWKPATYACKVRSLNESVMRCHMIIWI